MPPNLDHSVIDEVHWLNDREAFVSARSLTREQMVFGGSTSGSVYRVLKHLAEREPAGTRVVGIFPDRGDRYHDSVYSDEYWEEQRLDELPLREEPLTVDGTAPVEAWSRQVLGRRN
ncbi:hypothetical protein ACH4CE_17165 [Streptomyces gelaticus]|uniref:hypothetical protein n=1 Tax=Streptomyces gelaticus TaxID=285446 RepID=UPI0037932680